MRYIVAFSIIFLIIASNLMIYNGNYILAYHLINIVSSDVLDRYPIIPIKDTKRDFGNSYFTSNPVLQELKNRLCENKPDDILCNPLESNDGKSKNQHNDDSSDKLNKRMEKLNQKLLEPHERNKAKDKNYNDDKHKAKNHELSLKSEKKQDKANKEIDKLKDKMNKENNKLLLKQNEDNKVKDKNYKDKKNVDDKHELKITGLDLKIQKIHANLDKKLDKLKDKIENIKDNQLLVQEHETNTNKDDGNGVHGDNKDDVSHDTYDGYGFDGGNDNSNGNDKSEGSFNFATTGDFGCSTNTQNTVASIEKKKPELVLPLGDLSYHSTADCWFDVTSPLKGKMMVTLGFHDTQDGAAKMNQYLKSFQLEKPYYSYDYKKVHFLIMASQSPYSAGTEQYNFVKQDLEKSSQNKNIDWIVVTSYGPFYTSPTTHNAEKDLRNIYHPLFEKYGVDLVLQAHNHNYQRTYPIAFNPDESSKPTVINGVTTGNSNITGGTIFAVVGTGGQGFYPLQGQEPYVATQFDGKFGFLNIDINNGNPHAELTGTFYDNKGDIQDQFTIKKETEQRIVPTYS